MKGLTVDAMTLSEAVDRLQPSQRPEGDRLASEKDGGSYTWDLNTDYELASKFAEFGWREQAEQLDRYMTTIERLVEEGWSNYWDVTGECVDIGRFMSNEPECMLNFNLPKLRRLEFCVNISAKSSTDASQLFNRGLAIAAAVYALQSSGVAVSLKVGEWVSSCTEVDKLTHETMIEINSYAQYIDPARLAFWLAHPAALRRCIFRYNEQQSDSIRKAFGFQSDDGYGLPRNAPVGRIDSEDTIYIPFPEDMNDFETPEKGFEVVKKILADNGIQLGLKPFGS